MARRMNSGTFELSRWGAEMDVGSIGTTLHLMALCGGDGTMQLRANVELMKGKATWWVLGLVLVIRFYKEVVHCSST
jgi:hypothetical protein